MKNIALKNWIKIVCCVALCVLCLSCGLAGCATVGNITNSSNEILYYGNSAVMVDGYLYYANSVVDASSFSSDSDYKSSAKTTYLARLNTNADLGATSGDYSPANVETVSSEVTGYEGNFMFVLGQTIYYATPNRQVVSSSDGNSYNYTYTCIYKSSLNGNNKSKLYTTVGEITDIEVLKVDGVYYIVMLAGTDLIKINLSTNKAETIAEDVTSIAISKTYQQSKAGSTLDWNGIIYYTLSSTTESGSSRTLTRIMGIELSGGTAQEYYSSYSETIELIGRENDVVFYTKTDSNSIVATYYADMSGKTNDFQTTSGGIVGNLFYSGEASGINLIVSATTSSTGNVSYKTVGYIFYNTDGNLLYKNSNGAMGVITLTADVDGTSTELTGSDFNLLAIDGRKIYFSTTTGIYSADLSTAFNKTSNTAVNVTCNTILSMTAIYDAELGAYDGTYLYFYAQLEEIEDEDDDDDDDETDENYYLYRVNLSGSTHNYELLSKTTISSRHSA